MFFKEQVVTSNIENSLDNFILAPNPTNGIMNLLYTGEDNINVNFEVIDHLRKVMKSGILELQNNTTLDLSDLPASVYILRLLSRTEVLINERIILIK